MPRMSRVAVGGGIYHCINRSNGRVAIFNTDDEYRHFEELLLEGVELIGMRILAYCIMPNHWHLVLQPLNDGDMGEFMRWVTTTHVRQRRAQTDTIGHGHLYQGTYKSFIVETESYLQRLMVYVEQNPLRAKLVHHAEDWQWSSLWRRQQGTSTHQKLLSELPVTLPSDYLVVVNTLSSDHQLDLVRRSVNKGTPYGSESWIDDIVSRYNLSATVRSPGRPQTQV
jgi:putative transposase